VERQERGDDKGPHSMRKVGVTAIDGSRLIELRDAWQQMDSNGLLANVFGSF
jgi:hypothetical protein